MPQPIPYNPNAMGFRGHPRIVLERPKLAMLIGAIASEWGYIDNCLVDIYDSAISHSGQGWRAANPVNIAVFETLGALNPRLDIIETVLRMRVRTLLDTFAAMRKSLRKSAGERAFYIHANWSISDDFPDDLIITSGEGNVRYQERDFVAALDRIVELRNKVHDFTIAVDRAPRSES